MKYGILIPSLPTRATKCINSLLEDPALKRSQETWLSSTIPQIIDKNDLMRAHSSVYVERAFGEGLLDLLIEVYELKDKAGNFHRYAPERAEAPLEEIRTEVTRVIDSSYKAISLAIKGGFCYALTGGMHHAHPSFGHGFCLFNDIAVALLKAQERGLFKTAWIVDVDAHRGDGTAEIMQDHPSITTVSIHMASGWPLDSPQHNELGELNPSWIPGDVDIPIESGEEDQYNDRLMDALKKLERERGLPDLVFVVGGVDPYEKDELKSTKPMKLSKNQLFERDQKLYLFCEEREIPSAWVAAGGYGQYSWEIHSAFLKWALKRKEIGNP